MKTLTVTSEPFQRFRVELEDRLVEITLRYGSLRDRWSFDLSESGVALVSGQRFVGGTDLLRGHALRLGGLFVIPKDTTDVDLIDPNGENFPRDFELVAATQDEVTSLASAI
jgi:hypothetical protein